MIQIDMEMPEACGECRFCDNIGHIYFCKANNNKGVNRDVDCGNRNKDCPLREVK